MESGWSLKIKLPSGRGPIRPARAKLGVANRELPGWPCSLDREGAAHYVGPSPSYFSKLVAAGDAPKPFQPAPGSKLKRWRRADLKRWVAARAGQTQDRKRPNTWDDFEP